MDYVDPAVVMCRIDRMPKKMRALVHEYGYVIVSAMIDEGYRDPTELEDLLITWRCRRQEQWLETNYITRRTAESIAEATAYRIAARSWTKIT
jgi:hypothetical protein